MEKLVLELAGLDCPNCAEKINQRVSRLAEVSESNLDFINKKLVVTATSRNILSEIKSIVKDLEPNVEVKPFVRKSHAGESKNRTRDIIEIAVSLVLFIASFMIGSRVPEVVISLLAFFIAGYGVIISAVRNLIKGEAFDETLLMTIASVGALCIGDVREGAAVMIFFRVGELFQDIAVERSRKSITSLLTLKSDTVKVRVGRDIKEIETEKVRVGDVMVVRAGERVPIDGVVVSGNTSFDVSALTGEAVPVGAVEGSEVLSGSVNLNSVVEIRATKVYCDSTIAKILEMVENASEKKAEAEKFITKFARVYTPLVVAAAVLLVLIPSILTGFSQFITWLYRGLLFLVISCPCALVISVPLSFFAGIGGASKKGILIKGAKNIESLSRLKSIAFDKTGTLTKGKFRVTDIISGGDKDEEYILKIAAYAESMSTHPIAQSIVEKYGKPIDSSVLSDVVETAGSGVKAKINGQAVLCGTKKLLEQNSVKVESEYESSTCVYIALNGRYIGSVLLGDSIKKDSKSAVEKLKSKGISSTLLTGDKKYTAERTAKELGIENVYSELLPADKVAKIEELISSKSNRNVGFVGDGINDAPVIARSDVGFAMGGLGSDIAIEAADVVLMNDDPMSIPIAVSISQKTMKIVKENIAFAICVKLLIMILGAVGIADMWEAVFADVGVSVIAILNSLRAMFIKR